MRIEDLNHNSLLEFDSEGGTLRLAGQRALLLDAVAMGVLRKYLVENFGITAARAILTQFGFAHGWRLAEAAQTAFEWDSPEEWQNAGMKINSLQGLFSPAPGSKSPLSKEGAMVGSSYESEQHLLHFGSSEAPVCWTVSGITSGYLSRTTGKEIYILEDRCLARGDSACHLLGRTKAEWGETRAEELRFFDEKRLVECLDVSLHRVTQTLKLMEGKIRKHERRLIRLAPEADPASGLVAKSSEMRQLLDLTRRMAKVDVTVAISGESGTGKERIARLLHDESARATGPFIAINCAAITESLLESELFGHARGSFSGALHDRPGLFEAANGGTLLLDEIGELPLGMQTKLLRVLQEREVRRVGENKSRPIDVRIVAASNIDLETAVAENTFRQDLYYRLKIVALHVPPLRERREDILTLSRVLMTESATRMSRASKNLSTAAADRLLAYQWPGNVRELENAMERAVALSEGARIELADLPEEVRRLKTMPPPAHGHDRPLYEVEKEHILASLEKNGGNQARTSEQLKIGSATLYRKLKSYGALGTKGP